MCVWTLLDLYFLSKVDLMTSRCNKEMHAAGKSNLEDDQVIYDRRIVLFLSSFLDLLLSTFSRFSFSLISLVSTAHGHSRRTRYPSKRRAGCCWWDEYQVATSHSPFIPVTRSRSRERRTTNYNLHKYRRGVSRYPNGHKLGRTLICIGRWNAGARSLVPLELSLSF